MTAQRAEPAGERGAVTAGTGRVTTLELFFDLVFVFTITQLSAVLAHDLGWAGLLHVALMLGVIWFMYGGYAWLTNAIATDRAANRALLLAGMCGYFVLALAVPRAFGASGLAFGLGYALVVAVHMWLFAHAAGEAGARGMVRLAPSNLAGAAHGTEPAVGDVVEARPRWDAAVRVALVGVVDEPARGAHPELL